MTEIILHHYEASPFAEKIRVLFGYKQLSWRSVDIPFVMPKPDVVALTGGYRKTPVLQVGCDVYCDTALIVRVVERLFPGRPVLRARSATSMAAARWFDRELFMAAISQLFDRSVTAFNAEALGGPAAAAAFGEDRARMMGNTPVRPPRSVDGRVVVEQTLLGLEAQLAGGGPFLEGAELGWVDLCAYHPLWAMRRNRGLSRRLDAYPGVLAWYERIRAFGHGSATPLTSEEALQMARVAAPRELLADPDATPDDRVLLGDEVEVAAVDYGLEPSFGRLVGLAADELVIEREDARAGRVRVHFPRLGFRAKPRA